MAYIIIRDNGNLGPFNEAEMTEFVRSGVVLSREKCYDTLRPGAVMTIGDALNSRGVSTKVQQSGHLFSQFKTIGGDLLLPNIVFTAEPWTKDRRLMLMAIVGLFFSVLINMTGVLPDLLIFYIVSLYFAVIWGLFFYYLFCTEQVKLKTTISVLFSTQLITFILFMVIGIGGMIPAIIGYNFWGCTLGIGVPEELTKLAIIMIILLKSKEVLSPATMVYYGLMSGIAFGIYEGVLYQTTTNYSMLAENGVSSTTYTQSFLLNIARLTSLPFLHAIWCGIGSYYLASSFIFPHYKASLITLAILIPAVLHGLYDYLLINDVLVINGISILSVIVVFLSAILLMVYLARHSKLEQKLR